MVQRFLFVTFLVSLLVSSGTIPVEMQCSRSPNYRGESLHPGVNLDEFPAEFDLSGDLPPDLVPLRGIKNAKLKIKNAYYT